MWFVGGENNNFPITGNYNVHMLYNGLSQTLVESDLSLSQPLLIKWTITRIHKT